VARDTIACSTFQCVVCDWLQVLFNYTSFITIAHHGFGLLMKFGHCQTLMKIWNSIRSSSDCVRKHWLIIVGLYTPSWNKHVNWTNGVTGETKFTKNNWLQKGYIRHKDLQLPWLIMGYRFNYWASLALFWPYFINFWPWAQTTNLNLMRCDGNNQFG
jgi:hypothetical protein